MFKYKKTNVITLKLNVGFLCISHHLESSNFDKIIKIGVARHF